MSIGYACLTLGVPNTQFKTCVLKNATEEKIQELIDLNLASLEKIIDYNIENDIKLFRITSDLIPFGSSPINKVKWWNIFDDRFKIIGQKIINSGMRVSMHPGQYTVLNSPDKDVVARAIEDLKYHTKVLDLLGVDSKNKIILHIGGVYNDKKTAIDRFMSNYKELDESIKNRLVIENDDKLYNIEDVFNIGIELNIPVVFDNLHNEINPFDSDITEIYWIDKCRRTWGINDGKQKIHYSQQDSSKKPGAHSSTIKINEFMMFYTRLSYKDTDIMLEVKDKNLSAIKCINNISLNQNINVLEREWSKYKYKVLEHSHQEYLRIRRLLQNKDMFPVIPFYNIIEDSLEIPIEKSNSINALQHVWGYFKNSASKKEKDNFIKNLESYKEDKITLNSIKKNLFKLAVQYNESYLLNSYYFID